MATTYHPHHQQHKPRDANMNAYREGAGDSLTMYAMPGSPAAAKHKMAKHGHADIKKPNMPSNMHYRDTSRRRDPSPDRSKTSPFPRPAYEDFDDPPSPDAGTGNYSKDRIQNDLLDEICSDIGIRDSTDLDIFDFDNQTDQYIIGQTRLPDDLESLDETISFSDFQPEGFAQTEKQRKPAAAKSLQYNNRPNPLPPINQRPVTDEQKCASQDVFNSHASECLASPTVSSTCPGSHPRPASQGSAASSPAMHQFNQHPPDDYKSLKKELQQQMQMRHNSSSRESPVPSPAISTCSRGPPSVECLTSRGPPSVECLGGRFGPPSVNNDRADVTSTTPGPTDDHLNSSCMLSSSPDRKFKPATPGTPQRHGSTGSAASIAKPQYPTGGYMKPESQSSEQYPSCSVNSGGVGTGSAPGNQHLDPIAKDKVMRFLDQSQPSGNVDPPTEPGSASSSPPQHVAKKARIINSGNDLLEEMRNRYAFVKGADMYNAPNKHPNIDGTYTKPPPAQQQGFQGQYSTTPNINFADTSCMNPGSQSQFKSCAQFNGNQQQQQRPPSNGYYNNNMGQYQTPDYNRSMSSDSSQQQQMYPNQQNNQMYGSCPNLGPQQPGSMMPGQQHPGVQQMANNRPFSPSMGRPGSGGGVPVAQPKMSAQGYNNVMPGGYGHQQQQQQQQQYETPCTSPTPGGAPNPNQMYNNSYNNPANRGSSSSMNHSFSAPNTPMKQGRVGSSSSNGPVDGYNNPQQQQWGQQQQQQGYGNNMPNQTNMYNNRPPSNGGMQQQQPTMNPAMRGMNTMPGQYNSSNNNDMQMRQQQQHTPYNNNNNPNCMMNQLPPNLPGIPTGPIDTQTPVSQHGFMQSIITDRSSAFRSHPLFPLLRDLIIADMNFHTPSFPFQLIANLPQDFDRLLQNYLHRNPPMPNYQGNEAVEGVIMDALKYAHRALIEKIQCRKQKEGYKETPKPISAIEDFCERFDRAVKNSMVKTDFVDNPSPQDPFLVPTGHPQRQPTHPHTDPAHPMTHHHPQHHPMGPPGTNPHMMGQHSQSYTDLTHMKPGMGPGPGMPPYGPPMPGGGPYMDPRRASSLPSTPRKPGRQDDGGMISRTGSDKNVSTGSSGTGTGKSKVLPKESVAYMMDWLRAHQDNPYPNDDEKEMLIQKTKLTINQINYWFTNARRRILPKWALQRYMEQQEKQKQLESQQQQLTAVNH